jgi:hypothetical protein
MPIVAMVAIDLLDMAVLRLTLAPSQHHLPVGQEHGRTIPLRDISNFVIGIEQLDFVRRDGRRPKTFVRS